MDAAALAISMVALTLSGLSVVYTRRQADAARDATKIEAARRADEVAIQRAQRAALLVAVMRVELDPESRQIRVTNDGPHSASDVRLIYDGANDGRSQPLTQRWRELSAELRPGESDTVLNGLSASTTIDFRAWLEWTDGRGQQRESFRLRHT